MSEVLRVFLRPEVSGGGGRGLSSILRKNGDGFGELGAEADFFAEERGA